MKFAFPFINDTLGNSIIYEEYKGDFIKARQFAEEKLKNARRYNDLTQLADALLSRGVVDLLQGEPTTAISYFTEVESISANDLVRQLRAATYANLATYWHYNVFPDGNSGNALEISTRWDSISYLKQNSPYREALLNQVSDPQLRLEITFIDELLVNVLTARSFLNSYRSQQKAMTEQLLKTALTAPQIFQQEAESTGIWSGLLAYSELVAADLCRRADHYDLAQNHLLEAESIYRQVGDLAGAALCEMTKGDWLAAPYSTPVVWNYAIQEGSQSSELSWTIESREFNGDPVDSTTVKAVYKKAEELFSAAGAKRGLAAVKLRHGYLSALTGDYSQARDCALQAQKYFATAGDRLGMWVARVHHTLCLVGLGYLPEDRKTATALGTWGREKGSFSFTLGLGLLFGRVGRHWLFQKGDYNRALACYHLAETVFQNLGAVSNEAQSLVDRGVAYKAIGEPNSAADAYEEARSLYIKISPAKSELMTRVRWRLAHLEQEIYSIYEQHRNTDGMARSLERLKVQLEQPLPLVTDDMNNLFTTGISLLTGQSLKLMVEAAEVMLPRFRASQARDAGDEKEAQRQFIIALSKARQVTSSQKTLQEASVLAHQRRYGEAVSVFKSYLNQGGAMSGFSGSMANLITTFFGEEGQALTFRQTEQSHEQAATFFNLVKEYAEAKQHLDALEQIAGSEWWKRNQRPWETLLDYAEVYEGLGQLSKALEHYVRAIAELETQRGTLSRDELKTAFVSGLSAQHIYFGAARTALKLYKQNSNYTQAKVHFAQAFNYAERGKARALLDLIASSALAIHTSSFTNKTLAAWRQLTAQLITWRGLLSRERNQNQPDRQRITYLRQKIAVDEAELQKVEAELAVNDPNFYQAINPNTQVITLDDVIKVLPTDTALLQYYFLGEDLLAWAITGQGQLLVHHVKLDTKALERQIRAFHQACQGYQRWEQLGSQLAEQLLKPMATIIQGSSKLIFVPYGVAHTLPFHTLPWQGQPLVTTHSISYLPSASTLQFLKPGNWEKLPLQALAIGNPAGMAYKSPVDRKTESLKSLPAATTEAVFAISLFPQGQALLGKQATKSEVRQLLAKYPVLHFATHGYLSETEPLLSSIILADGESLSVYELMGLPLNADLVVVSACRTALGQTTGGDDVLGLTRGLLGTGARAAVVSLWSVNDISTSLLMAEFYRNLRDGKTPAVALQAAQNYLRHLSSDTIEREIARLKTELEKSGAKPEALDVLRDTKRSGAYTGNDYSHPFYWAPFIHIG